MAISPVTNALGGTTTTTSFSITLPTTRVGDLIILEYVHRGTPDGTIGGTYTGPAFLEKHEQLFASSTFTGRTLWSRATGDHSGQTVTGSGLTNSCAAIVTTYRGAKDSGDPLADATIVGAQNAAGDETQPEITTATNGAYVVLVVANSPDVAVTSQSCTSPGALTARAEVLSTGGTDTSIAHASAAKASAGATGAFTWAQTDGAGGSWAYAIIPAPETLPYTSETDSNIGTQSAPQQSTARELCGYGVFMACAALFITVVAPDPIGAAEYTVGTHQAAIASQNRSWVRTTSPLLIPASPVIVAPIGAAPEQVDSGYAQFYGPTPQTASAVIGGTRFTAPEQIDSGSAKLSRFVYPAAAATDPTGAAHYTVGTHGVAYADGRAVTFGHVVVPAVVEARIGRPLVAAPSQVDSGSALLFGPTPATASAVIRGTRFAAPEQVESGSAELSRYVYAGAAVAPDAIGGTNYTVGSHQAAYAANNGYAVKFGRYPPPEPRIVFRYFEVDQESTEQRAPVIFGYTPSTVAAPTIPPSTLVAAPEQLPAGNAWLWGLQPEGIDKPPPSTLQAAPEQIASGSVWLARYAYHFVAGADPKIGQTRVSAPEQVDSGSAQLYGQQPATASAVPNKIRIAAPEQVNSGDGWTWGPLPAALDTPVLRTLSAAPEHINSGNAYVWGLFQPEVFGTDVAIGTTLLAAPEIIETAYYGYVQLKFEGWPELSGLGKPTIERTHRMPKPNRTHVAKQPARTLKVKPPNRTEEP